jgi:hypothetical protein
MALSEDERQRIREEELVRLQAQEEFRAMHPTTRWKDRWHSLSLWLFCFGVLMGLWQVVKALAVT